MTDQERIRETYRGYESSGHDRRWDLRNPGFARLSRDRDEAVIALLARSLPGAGGRLLDVGCGNGSLIGTVAERWPDVRATGLDLLPDRIDEARASVPDATFVVGSADELPFDDGAFDVATAITLMSSIPTDDMEHGAAREIARVRATRRLVGLVRPSVRQPGAIRRCTGCPAGGWQHCSQAGTRNLGRSRLHRRSRDGSAHSPQSPTRC